MLLFCVLLWPSKLDCQPERCLGGSSNINQQQALVQDGWSVTRVVLLLLPPVAGAPQQHRPVCASRDHHILLLPRQGEGLPGGECHLPHGRRSCADDQQACSHQEEQVPADALSAHSHRPR